MTNMTGSKLSIFSHPRNNRLLDYYKIISISRPILSRANMGLDFVSGQYGCLFSRCRKYVINSLIHGHFHIGLVIIPRPILVLDCVSGQYGGLGMITWLIWKCPCINLYLISLRDTDAAINVIKAFFIALGLNQAYNFRRTINIHIEDTCYHVQSTNSEVDYIIRTF